MPAVFCRARRKTGLSALVGTLNTQVNGAYLFAGINADVKPIADYDQSPARSQPAGRRRRLRRGVRLPAVGPAGRQHLGQPTCRPFSIRRSPICSRIPAWKSTWSAASDQNVRSRISTSELIETSANANDDAIRKLASAYTMVADLGTANLNQSAYPGRRRHGLARSPARRSRG